MFNSISKMAQICHKTDILSVGVDAYTCVFRGPHKVEAGLSIVQRFGEMLNERGLKSRIYRSHGYEGLINDFYFYGVKGQNVLFGCVGSLSVEVEEACRNLFPDVTRMDWQVTVNLPFAEELLAEQFYREQVRMAKIRNRYPEPRLVASPTGQTLYVGKRGSGIMLRVYDKGEAFGVDPGLIWRFEVEMRDELAIKYAHNLARKDCTTEEFILNNLFHQFYQRGIRVPIEYGEKREVIGVPSNGAGHAAYLEWARRVVGPTMQKLSGFNEGVELLREMGIQTTFLDSLNLQNEEDKV